MIDLTKWQRTATEEKESLIMALTRKFLSAMGIEDDKIDEIISAHSDTVNGLKDKISEAEEKAKNAEELQKQLDEAKKQLSKEDGDEYKEKYETLSKEFDEYKEQIQSQETSRKKEKAYRSLLKDAGVSEKRHDAIMKLTDLSSVELDGDNIKDKDNVIEGIKTEWSDFVVTESKVGANTKNPPANQGGGTTMTKEQIRGIKDHAERQKAMMENASLFGLE